MRRFRDPCADCRATREQSMRAFFCVFRSTVRKKSCVGFINCPVAAATTTLFYHLLSVNKERVAPETIFDLRLS
ncbi:hypothetical protein E4U32_006783 [Claviceps aff. humidiphila group G2b]|nr:hypothetical protein E4U32_006783 [Claviceps aff. humidiphila group G2b]